MLELDDRQHHPAEIQTPPVAFYSPRDSFVAATAIKIENLQNTVARLEREAEEARTLIANLAETVEQNHRFYTFQRNDKRLKELRWDDLMRCYKELKARIDRIEGADRAAVDVSRTTFPAVNERIDGIARDQNRIEDAALGVRRHSLFLLGGIFLVLVVLCFRIL